MKLQRAIAKHLTDNIPGLYAFKDDIAFAAAGNPYPCFLVDLSSRPVSAASEPAYGTSRSTTVATRPPG